MRSGLGGDPVQTVCLSTPPSVGVGVRSVGCGQYDLTVMTFCANNGLDIRLSRQSM